MHPNDRPMYTTRLPVDSALESRSRHHCSLSPLNRNNRVVSTSTLPTVSKFATYLSRNRTRLGSSPSLSIFAEVGTAPQASTRDPIIRGEATVFNNLGDRRDALRRLLMSSHDAHYLIFSHRRTPLVLALLFSILVYFIVTSHSVHQLVDPVWIITRHSASSCN